MRSVYMMTDLEGVAGVVSFEDQAFASGRYYDQAKRLVTAEVNAAVEGLLDAGIEDVLICDGHGAGGMPSPNSEIRRDSAQRMKRRSKIGASLVSKKRRC